MDQIQQPFARADILQRFERSTAGTLQLLWGERQLSLAEPFLHVSHGMRIETAEPTRRQAMESYLGAV